MEFSKEEYMKSIEHACKTIRKNINDTIEVAFKQAESIDSDNKLRVLNILKNNNILPIGQYYYDSPDTIRNYLDSEDSLVSKFQTYYFTEYPENDIADDENRDDVINEIWDYVKEHKIIGCVNDW